LNNFWRVDNKNNIFTYYYKVWVLDGCQR